jgi:hypothetical protein
VVVRSADGHTHISPWRTAVTKLIRLAAAAGLALGIAGCANPPTQVGSVDNLLIQAGFVARPADSPHRISEMMKMTPNKFVTRVRNGQPVYLYPDPMGCKCVYFGSQQNWNTYRQLLAAAQIPGANQMTPTESQLDWDFGLWALPDQGSP